MRRALPPILVAIAALCVAMSPAAAQQTGASRLIAEARQAIEDFDAESAYRLLQRALDQGSDATQAERLRGLILLGISALMRSDGADRIGARQAFERALRLNPAYDLPDSLAGLHSDARVAFVEARQLVPLPVPAAAPVAVIPFAVELSLAADTTLPVQAGRFSVRVAPNRPAEVIAVVTPADVPTSILWADTQRIRGAGVHQWDLRSRSGDLVPEGRYAIRLRAVDSLNQVWGPVERIIAVSRVPADTAAHPAPLPRSAFRPETLTLRRGSPSVLLVGAGVGAAAFLLPTLGNPQLNTGASRDVTAVAVAGVASVAGIVGYLTGHRVRYSAENARANAELRRQHEARRAEIARSNRALIAAAPIRVRLER
ncbi:MAG TPA: hypothetical protein VNL98_01830 [Gemmatimonadales bacterium]|nr:hypothetical protein [Gemmatimonadales bacterium]